MNPLSTASNPEGSGGLPGIQPGDPSAGIGGFAMNSLSDAFQKGVNGPSLPKMPGMAAEGAQGAGGLEGLAPLLAL